jgi:hypothetical protein
MKSLAGIAPTVTLFILATALGVGLAPALAHADPPAPVQCKQVSWSTLCRYSDGHVEQCGPMPGCRPVIVALAPEFWDQP